MLDAGQVGTEMLYYLVGSRELDGGLMCTASHNPKAYTGAKLVSAARSRSRARTGIGDIRALDREHGLGSAPRRRRTIEEVDMYGEFHDAGAELHRPPVDGQAAEGRRRRRQRHGRPDGRAAARALGLDLSRPTGRRTGVPRPRAQPAAAREPRFIVEQVRAQRSRPGDRVGRRRRPLLLHRRHGRVRGRRLPDGAAGGVAAEEKIDPPPETILYDVRASRAVADTVARRAARRS